ncbi:MAG: branched-chain amino acid ABC transporter substrate-binding protein [Deltaproteobacteria bacterium]|nr:branched-chain amino acid ABC transporter substrate-binding protein [Deltaproteobacteria bacterium]
MKGKSFCLLVGLVTLGLVLGFSPLAGAAEKTVTIGFTASQTGKLNVEGMRQVNGLNLWVDQVNAKGGVKLPDGTVVKFAAKFYDDESKKERVQELYTRLINQDKADFLISPYSSGLADAAAVISQQNNRILITAGAASDSTYKKGYSLVFQTYTPASRYLTGAIDMLAKMDPQAKKVAIVNEKDKFSTDVVNALKAYATVKGYQVVLFEGYEPGATDFAPFINKIPPGVDAVMGGGHFSDTSTFAKQLFEKGMKAKMVALLVAPPEDKFAELGDAALGVIGPSQWEPQAQYSPETAKAEGKEWYGPTVDEFTKAYRAKAKVEPTYHSAGGYVAGLLLQKAIEQSGSTDTAKVKAVLDALDIYTFYGRIKFDATPKNHGLQLGHDMIYIQWQKDDKGKLFKQVVWPEASKTGAGIPYRK